MGFRLNIPNFATAFEGEFDIAVRYLPQAGNYPRIYEGSVELSCLP